MAEADVKTKETESRAQTMSSIVRRQFMEHRMAVAGFITIWLLIIVALCAPWFQHLTGISPEDQNVFQRYKPFFSKVDVPSEQKEIDIENYIRKEPGAAAGLAADVARKNLMPGVSGAVEPELLIDWVMNAQSDEQVLLALDEMGTPEADKFAKIVKRFRITHVFGTDELGRDVFMRLVYAARVSIGVGILSALAAAVIGLVMGTVAGFYGGFVDTVLSRITDALLALPILPLMIVFAAVNLSGIPVFSFFMGGQNESISKLVIIIVLFSWMGVSRLVRGSILTIKQREFVLAAKTIGASDGKTILSHIIPNVLAPLLVAVTLGVGQSILFESALSFLGLGIQPPTPSWGNMLFNAQEILNESPMLAVLPGFLIFLTVVSFNFIGDGLQDAIDPKTIKR